MRDKTNVQDALKDKPRVKVMAMGYFQHWNLCEMGVVCSKHFFHEAVTIVNGVIAVKVVQEGSKPPVVNIQYELQGGRNTYEELPVPESGKIHVPTMSLPAGATLVITPNFHGELFISLKYRAD